MAFNSILQFNTKLVANGQQRRIDMRQVITAHLIYKLLALPLPIMLPQEIPSRCPQAAAGEHNVLCHCPVSHLATHPVAPSPPVSFTYRVFPAVPSLRKKNVPTGAFNTPCGLPLPVIIGKPLSVVTASWMPLTVD